MLSEVVEFNRGTESLLNLRMNPQRRSLKSVLLLFIVPYTVGARDTENYLNPDITKVDVTINGSPNRLYNEGIKGIDMWNEVSQFFGKKGDGTSNINLTKYLTDNKFGLFIHLRAMADATLHGNGKRLVNTNGGVQLAIARTTTGSDRAFLHSFRQNHKGNV